MFGVMNRCLQGTVCSSYLLHYLYFSVGTAHRLARQIGEDVVHIGLLQLAFQLIRRSQSFYFTIHHDGYSVAILRFVHVMSDAAEGRLSCAECHHPACHKCLQRGVYSLLQ